MNPNEQATRTSDTTVRSLTEEVEVAIVGAGPTGLTLAGMLSGYGIRTAVLDGAQGPSTPGRPSCTRGRWRPWSPWASWTRCSAGASWFRASACVTATASFSA